MSNPFIHPSIHRCAWDGWWWPAARCLCRPFPLISSSHPSVLLFFFLFIFFFTSVMAICLDGFKIFHHCFSPSLPPFPFSREEGGFAGPLFSRSSLHPSIHPFIDPFIHSFINSFSVFSSIHPSIHDPHPDPSCRPLPFILSLHSFLILTIPSIHS